MINIVDILDDAACAYPHKIALRCKGRFFTYSEMKDRVDRLATVLQNLGTKKQDHVAIITSNSNACIEIIFACARLGAVCEQYNTRLSALSIVGLLKRSDAHIVFLSNDARELLDEHLNTVERPLISVLLEGTAADAELLSYEKLIAVADEYDATADTIASDAAIMLYTSGTTGMPRGVLLSHEALMARVKADTKAMGFVHNDVILCVLPLFHVTCVSVFVALSVGAELVIADSHKPEAIAENIQRFKVTRIGLVPFLLRALAAYVEQAGITIETLKLIIYGGEPISVELLTRCRQLFSCDFLQGYGMTETASAITMLLPEQHAIARNLSTVGKVVPGMELKIVNKMGDECLPGVIGEVLVKTKTLMLGYYLDKEHTEHVVRDGWYCTGDVGVLDGEGFLTLVDRKNNLVITGGENVYPLEVSNCIKSMGNDIVDAVVVGVPDAYWGESLVAFVVRKAGSVVSEADIISFCSRRLGGYKKPRKILFVAPFMRNASGKISKDCLDELKKSLI